MIRKSMISAVHPEEDRYIRVGQFPPFIVRKGGTGYGILELVNFHPPSRRGQALLGAVLEPPINPGLTINI